MNQYLTKVEIQDLINNSSSSLNLLTTAVQELSQKVQSAPSRDLLKDLLQENSLIKLENSKLKKQNQNLKGLIKNPKQQIQELKRQINSLQNTCRTHQAFINHFISQTEIGSSTQQRKQSRDELSSFDSQSIIVKPNSGENSLQEIIIANCPDLLNQDLQTIKKVQIPRVPLLRVKSAQLHPVILTKRPTNYQQYRNQLFKNLRNN